VQLHVRQSRVRTFSRPPSSEIKLAPSSLEHDSVVFIACDTIFRIRSLQIVPRHHSPDSTIFTTPTPALFLLCRFDSSCIQMHMFTSLCKRLRPWRYWPHPPYGFFQYCRHQRSVKGRSVALPPTSNMTPPSQNVGYILKTRGLQQSHYINSNFLKNAAYPFRVLVAHDCSGRDEPDNQSTLSRPRDANSRG